MHELPQLGRLAKKYCDTLAVIGVQSPKYTAEGDAANLRSAVQRYQIEHPVVDDPENLVWNAYSVSAWPTLVFLSPAGLVIGKHAGEATFEALDRVITQMISEYEREGSLLRGPIPYQVDSFFRPMEKLSFPGKVLPTADRIFIADSGHNRIVVTDPEGSARLVIGRGEPGLEDGEAASARFCRPQGMALDTGTDTLYVADSGNHAIRAVDLKTRVVRTVAGTGRQAIHRLRSGSAREMDLSSPWDVVHLDGTLFIAMAGLHQIWTLELGTQVISVWAGTGHEALKDGQREQAWFAQPMGLSLDGDSLYVACAEAQAVRHIDIASGQVNTLVGRGLYDFGDSDGPISEARLQHCQGAAVAEGGVYVADTYNNKIKLVTPGADIVTTFAGSGEAGELDGPGEHARFWEPGGIAGCGDTLWVADTNNHLIRTVDLASGHVRTFAIQGHGLDIRGI